MLSSLSDGWFYTLVVLGALLGLFLLGLLLSLGAWVGYGLLADRSDRKRDRAWQEWQQQLQQDQQTNVAQKPGEPTP